MLVRLRPAAPQGRDDRKLMRVRFSPPAPSMYPRVIFRYSWIYDEHWRSLPAMYWRKRRPYPSAKKIEAYARRLEKAWRPTESKLLREMSRVTGLPWKQERQLCYVVGRAIPFSDPLTIPVYRIARGGVDVLTHEMIHRLFSQEGNFQKISRPWQRYAQRYRHEDPNTKIHIYLSAIHQHLLLKFFGRKRWQEEVRFARGRSAYSRTWDIVAEVGYQKILSDFSSR